MTTYDPRVASPRAAAPGLRTLLAIGAGNALEWFDWNIYATFATFFAPHFFGSGGGLDAMLKTLAVFAVGFVARPFGGIVFGWLADRHGRRPAMLSAVSLAALGSLGIGLTPSAEHVGAWAGIALVTIRLLQGLAHGAELPISQTYLAELAPPRRRGLWSSAIYFSGMTGVCAGTLLGAVLTTLLSHDQLAAYGWRIPFILGGLLGLAGLYLRTRLVESDSFESSPPTTARARQSWIGQIVAHRRSLLLVVALTMGATVTNYVWAVAAPEYAISVLGVDPGGALWAGVGADLVFLALLPAWGLLSDRVGRRPPMIGAGIGIMVLLFPLNAFIDDHAVRLFVAMGLVLALLAALAAVQSAVFAELFPTGVRASGIGLPYSVAVALFGGTAPLLQTWFADHHLDSAFVWYTIALMALSVLATIFVLPETRARDLDDSADAFC